MLQKRSPKLSRVPLLWRGISMFWLFDAYRLLNRAVDLALGNILKANCQSLLDRSRTILPREKNGY